MLKTQVAIVGAGLSGLYAASLLEQANINYLLLEGRAFVGGRIQQAGNTGVDLGATWIWPAVQPEIVRVLSGLGVALIPQNETGDLIYERAMGSLSRYPGYVSTPAAMRVRDGMSQVTEKLYQRLPAKKTLTGLRITHAEHTGEEIRLRGVTVCGEEVVVQAEHLLLALPPMLVNSIRFTPALPRRLTDEWGNTGTWMAPQAKYVALYDDPFWTAEGLSGEGRSMVGPLVELHDVSVPGGVNALFGFLGIPASSRHSLGEERLLSLCRAQMVRLFGEKAAFPSAEFLKDWSADPFTAAPHDLVVQAAHHVPPAFPSEGVWAHCLTGIASEWSPTVPGYLAGAIEAAREGVNRLTVKMASKTRTEGHDTERKDENDL